MQLQIEEVRKDDGSIVDYYLDIDPEMQYPNKKFKFKFSERGNAICFN